MPVKTAWLLIFSEHKNYISLILFLASFKIILNSVMLINLFGYDTETLQLSISRLLLLSIVPMVIISLISFLITRINIFLGLENRLKDNLTVYSYSFVPLILVLCVLTPVEFALFGSYWFTFNPSPFLMKPASALVLIGIEGLFLLWGQVLVITSTYAQSKNIFYSIIAGVAFFFSVFAVSIYSILSFH